MLFSVATSLFLLASSAVAAPSNLEKKNVVTVYKNAQPHPQNNYNVVYKTVVVGKPRKHKHNKPKSTTCLIAATQPHPGYQVVTKTIVYGPPKPTYVAPKPPKNPYNPPKPPKPTYVAPQQPSYPQQPPTYGGGNDIASVVLAHHNAARAKHGCAPLVWDNSLAQAAQNGGYHCLFKHISGNSYGENLAKGYSDVGAACDAWYNEISSYNYGNPTFGMGTGHFTQVVWKNTKKVGCALQDCSGGKILRCEYSPPGNYMGQFSQNVPPLGGGGY